MRFSELSIPAHSEKMEVSSNHRSEVRGRDATQDYPESGPEIQVLCVHKRALDGQRRSAGTGGRGRRTCQRPAALLELWSAETGLRPVAEAAVRVCAPVGHQGVFGLCPAPGELPG